MKKLLLRSFLFSSYGLNKAIFCSALLLGILVTTKTKAQVIVETFEEAAWATALASNSASSTVNVNVTATSTATNQTITTYSANTTGNGTITTVVAASTGNWTWAYSRASIQTATNCQARKHSVPTSFGLASSTSYLITPIIANGIATLTFWAATSGSPTGGLYVGLRTNTNTTAASYTSYPTTAGTAATATILPANAYGAFPVNPSTIVPAVTSAAQYTYTYSGTNTAQLVFINNTGTTVFIDDIVITSPLIGIVPPALSAAAGQSVDNDFNITFTDANSFASSITGVLVDGNITPYTSSDYTITPGSPTTLTLKRLSIPELHTAASHTIKVNATGFQQASVTQTNVAGTATKLGMSIQPVGPGSNGGTLSTQPIVAIQDQYGNTVTSSSASVTAAFDPGFGSWTIGGTVTRSAVSGLVNTFNDLTATAPGLETNARIAFTSGGLTGITSAAFTIPPVLPLYRSNGTGGGNWNSNLTWEVSNNSGASWSGAVSTPTTADGTVTILSGDMVTVSVSVSADQVTINDGGTLIVGSGATLTIADGLGTDLTVNATTGTPAYDGDQTVPGGILQKSATGVLTTNAGATIVVNGTFDDLTVFGSGGSAPYTFTIGSGAMTVNGTYKISGLDGGNTTQLGATTGVTFALSGTLYIASGVPRLYNSFAGNVTWDVASNSGSGTIISSSSNAAAVTGNFNVIQTGGGSNVIYLNTGGTTRTLTVTGNVNIVGGILEVSSGNNASALTTTDLNISGGALYISTFNASAHGILNVNGNINHSAGSFGSNIGGSNGTIVFKGGSNQSVSTIGLTAVGTNNVTVNNGAGVTLGTDLAINGTLAFNAGNLNIGTHNLTLSNAVTTPGAGKMIIASGGGEVRALFTANGSYTFPVGDADGAAKYSPIALSFTASGYGGGAYASVKVNGLKHPNNANALTNSYLKRYWTVNTSGITSPSNTVTSAIYDDADIVNTEASILLGKWTGATPWTRYPGSITTGTNTLATATANSTYPAYYSGISSVNPTVSISANPALNVCVGTPVTLNASATGDPTIIYAWSGGLGSGTSAIPPTGSAGSINYIVTVTDGNGFTGSDNKTVIVTNTNTWTGGTSNWNNNTNWSCGVIPTSTNDVVIANGGHPTLDLDYTAAGSLTLNATSTLDIAPTKTLTVSGTADFGGQVVTFKSDATGSGSFGPLTGSITPNSDANVVVERYIPATKRAWRLLTIPVASSTATIRDAWADGRTAIASAAAANSEPAGYGTIITGYAQPSNANGYDFIGLPNSASSILKYDPSYPGWPASAAATPSLSTTYNSAEEGYMLFIRGDRQVTSGNGTPATNVLNTTTLRPKGNLKTGSKNYTVGAGAFKLIGNPYASTIDFDNIYQHNGTVSTQGLWTWDAALGSNGGYLTITYAGGYVSAPFVAGNLTEIHSGQAFFVKGATGGSFQIDEADKVNPASAPPYVFDATVVGKFSANLNYDNGAAGTQLVDGVLGLFADGNTPGTTDKNDVVKVNNFNENISLLRNGSNLAIEAHPMITGDDILYLSTTNLKVRDYTLQFRGIQMQSGLTAILQDAYLGKELAISTSDNVLTDYPFSVTADAASAASDRFRVVFKGGTLPLTLTSAKAYSLSNGVQVDWKTVNENGIRSYEVEKSADGRSFGEAITIAATGAGAYGWYDVAPAKGNNYYRIKGIGTNGDVTYSQVLMVNLNSGKSSFSIYPNPVKGGIVGVQFSNMEKGKYAMVVYNSAGQKVASRDITHLGGSATEEINLGTMASGVYRVSLISTSGSAQNQTLVIQK